MPKRSSQALETLGRRGFFVNVFYIHESEETPVAFYYISIFRTQCEALSTEKPFDNPKRV